MITVSSHISALSALIDHVRQSRDWVVVVAPSGGAERMLQSALTAVKPADATMGGRTLLLPGGGRVTVSGDTSGVAGDDFLVMIVGYDGELTPRDEIALHAWRQQARGTISIGEQPGELRIVRK